MYASLPRITLLISYKSLLQVFADDNNGVGDFNSAMTTVNLIVLNDFQRIAIIFNISVDVITAKQPEIVR